MTCLPASLRPLPFLFLLLGLATLTAAPEPVDATFATVDGQELKVRLWMPTDVKNPPLVVFYHGGGWRQGSYRGCAVPWLADHGFAVASVGYRLSQAASFPAQIHDAKAGLRWLRAHAKEYGYDASRVAVSGSSAGGYLALLMGVTGNVKAMEGTVGQEAGQDTGIACIVDYFGASDFILRSKDQPDKTDGPKGVVTYLLGGPVGEQPEVARFASPAFHVGPGDPPLLVLHGTEDKTVLFNQAERIVDAYQKAGLDVTLVPLEGKGHGGKDFYTGKYQDIVIDFLNKHLRAPKEEQAPKS